MARQSRKDRRARWRLWALVGLGVLLVVGGLSALALRSQGGASSAPRGVGVAPAPDALPDFPILVYQGVDLLGGQEVRLSDLFRQGKPVVLNDWASNCLPCTAEMPEFEKAWKQYGGRVLFLGLDVGRFFPGFGDAEASRALLKRLGITYPAGTPLNIETAYALRVQALPSTVFLAPDGRVVRVWQGPLTHDALTAMLEDLLRAWGG